jgi:hypothetical protein
MNKEDLIYSIVCDIRDQNNRRFAEIEKDVAEIKKWKATLVGYCGGVTLVGTFIIDAVKNFFIR